MLLPTPTELAATLIRFDTSNPPGNEAACIQYIKGLLDEAGLTTTLIAKDPDRPNLIARLAGAGSAPPLLLHGHVDVVTTAGQTWRVPPFEGRIEEGWLWGRGALDMKGGVAMMLAAVLRLVEAGITPPGDILLAITVDEEAGSTQGAKFLVEEHAEQFEGVRYALSEFGGFTLWLNGLPLYPITVAEKQPCVLRVTLSGPAGHGALPTPGGAMARLARFLADVDEGRTPVHVTDITRQTFETVAGHLPFPLNAAFRAMLRPALTDPLLNAAGEQARVLNPLLRNTISPTMLQASGMINVIPGEVHVGLDCRLLPGFTPDDMIAELRALTDVPFEVEVVHYRAGLAEPDMALFERLAGILTEQDADGIPIPLLLAGVSDARFFNQLGIQTYGFIPMKLPQGFNFTGTIHAADERAPVAALDFGTEALFKGLQRFG